MGVRAGGASRRALNEIMAEEREKGTPLFLLLDDFAGASLVAGWVWSRWIPDWAERARASGGQSTAGRRGQMQGLCTGLRARIVGPVARRHGRDEGSELHARALDGQSRGSPGLA